jgi:hypothetical protein
MAELLWRRSEVMTIHFNITPFSADHFCSTRQQPIEFVLPAALLPTDSMLDKLII